MRCRQAFALVLALASAAPAGPARAQPLHDRDVTVTNRAAQNIDQLYLSPKTDDSWGDDRLGDEVLEAGHSIRVSLDNGRECKFDVQAVYEDASREELHNVDMCRTSALSFDGAGAVAAPSATALHQVALANRAGRPIAQVLISPADAGDWGDDRLGSRFISVGDAVRVQYRGDCVADIRVVYDNRSAEERHGVDICAARRIVVRPGWTTTDTVPTETEPGSVAMQLHVVNHTGRPAVGLYLFPTGSADRGPDLLGGTALADQGELAIALQRPAATCGFEARVIVTGKRPEQKLAGLNLCRSADLVLPARG